MNAKRSSVFAPDTKPGGTVRRRALVRAWPVVEYLTGLRGVRRLYERAPEGCNAYELLDRTLKDLGVRVRADESELAGLPESGPTIVVANHPFGAVEGMILGRLLLGRRDDVKILANYFLGRIPELADLFLPIDPFRTPAAARSNLRPLRSALRWLDAGGVLVVFPAGEVAHLDLRRRGRIEDPPWLPTVAHLVRHADCPVVPVYFRGCNGPLFQLLGLIHPMLRTAMLGRELLRRRGSTIELRVGSPIPHARLVNQPDDEMLTYLRSRTYILAERPLLGQQPVQPRATPSHAKSIVAAPSVESLMDEIERLPRESLLVDAGEQVVHVAWAAQIPNLLREIGRQRELTFREVGEGTGREIDLDEFDRHYRHMFIWNHKEHEVVGAYRIGLTDELLQRGIPGLYTSTLFNYKPQLFEMMGPALEMGRSFIRPEYQKSYVGLMLLWKGIGQFVLRHPRCATLFGPVSISAGYQSASQRLIVSFLEQNKFAHEGSRWVCPRTPARPARPGTPGVSQLRNLEDVSSFISEIEADHKGVPVLLKQYLRLGGQLLGFNVDPDFSDVLDVLIMVDLRRTDPKILRRYMGRKGASQFLSFHRDGSESRAS